MSSDAVLATCGEALTASPVSVVALNADARPTDDWARRVEDWLSTEEQQRAGALRHDTARRLFLAGRYLLRGALGPVLGMAPSALTLSENAWGKPELAAADTGWHFNLSHSYGRVVLAVSRAGPVGVDVEYTQRRNRLPALAERYFSPMEQQWLGQVADEPEVYRRRFFAVWTLKEAFIKAMGRGLAVPLEAFGMTAEGRHLYCHREVEWPVPRVRAWTSEWTADYPLACVLLPADPAPVTPTLGVLDMETGRIQPLPVTRSTGD